MSESTKFRLEVAVLVLTLFVALAGAIKAWAVLPYRLGQVEQKAIDTDKRAQQIEVVLSRIDERTQNIQADIQQIKKQQP